MATYPVAAAADDWYYTSSSGNITGTTLLYAQENSVVSPAIDGDILVDIDLSGIPDDDVITAGTIYWYTHSYTTSKGVTKIGNCFSYDAGVYVFTNRTIGTGWESQAIPAGVLSALTKTGKSRFLFSVPDPGASKARTWLLRAYEYDGSGGNAVYLELTHAPAATTTFHQAYQSHTP